MENIDVSMFYNPHSMLTHKSKYNFIISMRGLGKTYGITKFLCKQFIKHGYQFVYVRRYKEEVSQVILQRFFKNVEKDPDLEGHEFKVKGKTFYIDEKPCGIAVALSQSVYLKSVALPDVRYMMYDEFQIDTKRGNIRYMQGEPDTLKDLVETVFRHRDDWQVFCLSNSISAYNPYFTSYKIYPNPNKEFSKKGIYLIQLPESTKFLKYKTEHTEAGAENKNTEYGQYALYNVFSEDSTEFIERKTHASNIHAIFKVGDKFLGFWHDPLENMMYISWDCPRGFRHIYCAVDDDMTPNTVLAKSMTTLPRVGYIRTMYRYARIRYENMSIKKLAVDMFSKLNF